MTDGDARAGTTWVRSRKTKMNGEQRTPSTREMSRGSATSNLSLAILASERQLFVIWHCSTTISRTREQETHDERMKVCALPVSTNIALGSSLRWINIFVEKRSQRIGLV